MRGTWTTKTHKYACGEWYTIGKVAVGGVDYVSGTKGDPAKYGVTLLLPGMKSPSDKYTNMDDAKARLERAVDTWFKWLEEK